MAQSTHHHFDHHATIRACEAGASKRVYQLRHNCTNEEHRHTHATKIRKYACSWEDDHAIYREIGENEYRDSEMK